jgi:hypothetical protein
MAVQPAPVASVSPTKAPADTREAALRKHSQTKDGKLPHRGFIMEAKIGAVGCTRSICRGGSAHDASPGLRVDGFLGGNFGGFFEFGLQGGWGKPRPSVTDGQNALSLYGIDPSELELALADVDGGLNIDLDALRVRDAQTTTAQIGPGFRIHFVPRGRAIAFVGSGISYNLFRARYSTDSGNARLDFHGFAVPIQGGAGVHLSKNVALGVEFNYLWTRYSLLVLNHPDEHTIAPVKTIESAAAEGGGSNLRRELPQFWTVTAALRARF